MIYESIKTWKLARVSLTGPHDYVTSQQQSVNNITKQLQLIEITYTQFPEERRNAFLNQIKLVHVQFDVTSFQFSVLKQHKVHLAGWEVQWEAHWEQCRSSPVQSMPRVATGAAAPACLPAVGERKQVGIKRRQTRGNSPVVAWRAEGPDVAPVGETRAPHGMTLILTSILSSVGGRQLSCVG